VTVFGLSGLCPADRAKLAGDGIGHLSANFLPLLGKIDIGVMGKAR
jgi:hypothetical protein